MHKTNRNKRILLYVGHPAHYHNLKWVAKSLQDEGAEVLFVARQKDVLFKLMKNCPFETIFLPARDGDSKLGLIQSVLQREWKMLTIIRRFRPDIMAGTDIVIAHLGSLLGIPSVLINEDDLDQVPLFARYGVRFCSLNLAPAVCRVQGYEHKTQLYDSYHELAYLHPELFSPDKDLIRPYIRADEPYFILRFASLTAHHDDGKKGITDDLAHELIAMLNNHGRVYITSERALPESLEQYRTSIPPEVMHHAMAFAGLYIGDSQTMAAEAAVLGTPSVRFNDFVGKLSYLDELEHKYELTIGIPTDRPERLLQVVGDMLRDPQLKDSWSARRWQMLSEKKNLAVIWTDVLLHYPYRQSFNDLRFAIPNG